MRQMKGFFFLLVVFFLTGCAWTNLYAVRNPLLSQVRFRKILVLAQFQDVRLRELTENTFVNKLRSSGINAIPSINIIPTVYEYNKEEFSNITKQNNIDGVLVVTLSGYWTALSYVPKTSVHYGYGSLFGNSFNYGYGSSYSGILNYQGYTQEYGGYYVSKPIAKFQIRLFDSKTGQVAWLATGITRGNAYANYDTLINSLANNAVRKLIEDNVIEKQ